MLVKRYVVQEMPEAMSKIRQDLGHDAIILSTKKIKTRGFLGFFGKTHIEVVAAANDAKPMNLKPAKVNKPIKNTNTNPRPSQSAPLRKQAVSGSKSIIEPVSVMEPTNKLVPKNNQDQPTRSQVDNPKVHSASSDSVIQEMQNLKDIMQKFIMNQGTLPDAVQQVRQQLITNDIKDDLIQSLILRTCSQILKINECNEQEFRAILTNLVAKEIKDQFIPSPLLPTSRVVSFVGPTGVGKTTTIAKIAAQQALHNGKKIGLITTDTFRVAAVEQLRTYADILNVPLEVVYTEEDLAEAIDNLSEKDLILLDTAGRNYGQTQYVEELNRFLSTAKPDETYLVLALTHKSMDLERIVKNFDGVSIDKFVYTKLDETQSYGAIYNLMNHFKKPVGYVTTGQNVPDDIAVITPEEMAQLITGELRYA